MTPGEYKQLRKERGLTQAALAALLGVSRETIVRRESGALTVTEEAALAIQSLPKSRKRPGTQNDKLRQPG